MNRSAGSERNVNYITVLSVGPHEQDHARLSEILAKAQGLLSPQSHWSLKASPSLPSALSLLRTDKIPLVVCEDDLGSNRWRDLWDEITSMPDTPSLIVTSRHADERLWAEALNLGAYDVLAKPFDPGEVVRTLSQAWLQRISRQPGRKPSSDSRSQSAIRSRAGVAV